MQNNFYSYEHYFEKKINIKNNIRNHSNNVGAAAISFIALSFVVSLILGVFDLTQSLKNDEILYQCFNIIFSITAIFLPFFIVMFRVKKYHHDDSFGFDRPAHKNLFLSAIPAGLMLCILGDRIASVISVLCEHFGVNLSTPSSDVPNSAFASLLFIISSCVVAPLTEEFAIRAVALQPLRKYGEKYAIIMTSLLFALMHQNMVQGIFAFIAGIVLGYFALATRSVWCSVVIHCLNNLLSVFTSFITRSDNAGFMSSVFNALVVAIYIFGTMGLVMFIKNTNRHVLYKADTNFVSTGEKVSAFLLSPPMIIVIVFLLINTVL